MRAMFLVLVVGCSGSNIDQDDGEAEGAGAVDPTIVGDAAKGLVGIYRGAAGAHETGDLTALELLVTTPPSGPARLDYVRARCYGGTACAHVIPETDRYDVYTSSANKTYIRFWSVTVSRSHGDIDTTPELVDVYEIKNNAGAVQLRKSYTSRWVTLATSSEADQCSGSGGTWGDGACACASGRAFAAGAGGCVAIGGASEQNCDASGGLWTDDDATLLGEYCVCGTGRYDDASGACAAIDP